MFTIPLCCERESQAQGRLQNPVDNPPFVSCPGRAKRAAVPLEVGWWCAAEAQEVRSSMIGAEGGGVVDKARPWARLLVDCQEGQTLLEYAITVFFVVIACIALLSALGVNVAGLFNNAGNAV